MVSIRKQPWTLAPRILQYHNYQWLLSAFPNLSPILNFASSWASFPPASHSFITLTFQLCVAWVPSLFCLPLLLFPHLSSQGPSSLLAMFRVLLSLSALNSYRCLWLHSHTPTLYIWCPNPQFIRLLSRGHQQHNLKLRFVSRGDEDTAANNHSS